LKLLTRFNVIPRRRLMLILIGIFLNAAVFSVSFTFLDSFQKFSSGFLGGGPDIAVIWHPLASTIQSGSIPSYLSESIRGIPGVLDASPEVLASVVTERGLAVSLRGISDPFFVVQGISVGDEVADLDYSDCILGAEVAKRLELGVGDTLTLQSSMRNVAMEFHVKEVMETGDVVEDEVLVNVDTARLFRGLSEDYVTLIRVKLDPDVISTDALREMVSTFYTLTVQTTTPHDEFETEISVLQPESLQVIEKSTASVPGWSEFELPHGRYLIEIGGQSEEVALYEDQTITFSIDPELADLWVNVFEVSTGAPVEGADIAIASNGHNVSRQTSKKSGTQFQLRYGSYNVTVDHPLGTLEKRVTLASDTTVNFLLGEFSLKVKVLDAVTLSPIPEATVSISSGEEQVLGYTDENGLKAFNVEAGTYQVGVEWGNHSAQKTVHLNSDPTLVFLLGSEEHTYTFTVKTLWINGSAAPFTDVVLEGAYLTIDGKASDRGILVFHDIPAGHYVLTCSKGEIKKTEKVEIKEDKTVSVIMPTPLSVGSQASPRFIRYLPQHIAVSLSSRVFDESMRILTNLIKSVIIILSLLLLTATVSGNYDIINNAVKENEKNIGVLRSVGANKLETFFAVGARLILYSGFVGVAGYGLGYAINYALHSLRLLTISGYYITPSFNPWILAASVALSSTFTGLALAASMRGTLNTSTLTLLKGLRRGEVLYFPKINIIFLAASFTLPFMVRAIPEVIVWPLPIGWDTVASYIPGLVALRSGYETELYDLISQRPFFWAVISLPYPLEHVNPFKVMPLLFHGLLGASAYLFARSVLRNEGKALAVSLFSTLYFVSLRVSWDLHANEMGLILLFAGLTLLRDEDMSWSKVAVASTLAFALTLTHEAASMLFFVTSIPEALRLSRKTERSNALKYLIIIALPLAFFSYRLVAQDFPMILNPMNNSRYPSRTYLEMSFSTVMFYVFSILPLTYLAVFGLSTKFDTWVLKSWLLGSSLAALSPVFSPTAAISFWTRWCYLSVYPLAFYTVEGLSRLVRLKIVLRKIRIPVGLVLGLLLTSQLVFISYQLVYPPPGNFLPYQSIFGSESTWIRWHFPSSLQLSTVYPEEASDAVASVEWLNRHIEGKAFLIVDEEFRGYAALHHDQEKILLVDIGSPWYINENWEADAESKAASLHDQGFEIYLLSRDHRFENFVQVTAGAKVSIFRYNP
jgi:ABC-type lipoprotein release transport system permease subunit